MRLAAGAGRLDEARAAGGAYTLTIGPLPLSTTSAPWRTSFCTSYASPTLWADIIPAGVSPSSA
jgi:hypothetical protein